MSLLPCPRSVIVHIANCVWHRAILTVFRWSYPLICYPFFTISDRNFSIWTSTFRVPTTNCSRTTKFIWRIEWQNGFLCAVDTKFFWCSFHNWIFATTLNTFLCKPMKKWWEAIININSFFRWNMMMQSLWHFAKSRFQLSRCLLKNLLTLWNCETHFVFCSISLFRFIYFSVNSTYAFKRICVCVFACMRACLCVCVCHL